MNTCLVFVRHGDSHHKAEGIVGGPSGCRSLTERGHLQAATLAEDLAVRASGASALYASPPPRTQETAAPIAVRLDLAVRTEPGLSTWTVAPEVDGLPTEEMRQRYSQTGGGTFRAFESVSETWSDLVIRTGKTLTTIVRALAGQTGVVVGHQETLSACFSVLGNLPLMPPFEVAADNASITIWKTEGDTSAFPAPRWSLLAFNVVPAQANG